MGAKMEIAIDENLPIPAYMQFPTCKWAFMEHPELAHFFHKYLAPFADTSGNTAILDKLAKGRKIGLGARQ
jgi:hypothetical protein